MTPYAVDLWWFVDYSSNRANIKVSPFGIILQVIFGWFVG